MTAMGFSFGVYGWYVWPAFGAAALILAALIGASLWRHAATRRRLRALENDSPLL